MSVKSTLKCLKQIMNDKIELIDRKIHIVDELKKIQFSDISSFFPKDYFVLDCEPLYAFKRKIGNEYFKHKKYINDEIDDLLKNLFQEQNKGEQRLFFSDFTGVTNTRENGMISFTKFKKEQFEINKVLGNEKGYDDYFILRHDVFNKDREGKSNELRDAKILMWSNSIYTSNNDRSHRFATLCKWDELENRHDSELFNVTEITLNEEKKNLFLENYDGFLLNEITLAEIINKIDKILQSHYSSYSYTPKDDFGYLIFKKKDINNKIRNIFLSEKNCIYINSLLRIGYINGKMSHE